MKKTFIEQTWLIKIEVVLDSITNGKKEYAAYIDLNHKNLWSCSCCNEFGIPYDKVHNEIQKSIERCTVQEQEQMENECIFIMNLSGYDIKDKILNKMDYDEINNLEKAIKDLQEILPTILAPQSIK